MVLAYVGHEGREKFCGCCQGHRRASQHVPIRLQIHHVVVHHTFKKTKQQCHRKRNILVSKMWNHSRCPLDFVRSIIYFQDVLLSLITCKPTLLGNKMKIVWPTKMIPNPNDEVNRQIFTLRLVVTKKQKSENINPLLMNGSTWAMFYLIRIKWV